MSRQLNCLDMYKIATWVDSIIQNNKKNGHIISFLRL